MLTLPAFLVLFMVLFVAYLVLKSVLFHLTFNINPAVFLTGRKKELLVWIVMLGILAGYGAIAMMHFYGADIGPVYALLQNPWMHLLGMSFLVIGFAVMVTAHAQMGQHWRMGIDRQNKGNLMIQGVFSISRNPIYGAILLQAAGLALLLKAEIAFILWLILLVCIHMVIRHEEEFLEEQFKEVYTQYKSKVRRFI